MRQGEAVCKSDLKNRQLFAVLPVAIIDMAGPARGRKRRLFKQADKQQTGKKAAQMRHPSDINGAAARVGQPIGAKQAKTQIHNQPNRDKNHHRPATRHFAEAQQATARLLGIGVEPAHIRKGKARSRAHETGNAARRADNRNR